jgi:uncharacterized protein (DUF2141 family)
VTTEKRLNPFKPYAFLAAFGLALALAVSPANAGNIPLLSSAAVSAGSQDYVNAGARDGSGNLYLVGSSSSAATSKDIWVSRWSEASMTVISTMILNGTGNGPDFAMGVAVDAGGVYVTGISSKAGLGSVMWLGKFTNSLAFVSSVTYPIPMAPNVTGQAGLAIAPSGNLYVVNTSTGTGALKITIAQFTPALTFVSSTTYFNGFDQNYGFGVTFDAGGSVYVAGSVAPAPLTSGDIWIGKFTSGLVYVTSATRAGGAGNTDQTRGIAFGSDGNLYVSGIINNAGVVVDLWLAKYSPSLGLLNQASFASPNVGNAQGNYLVATSSRLYVAGDMFTSGQGDNAWLGEFDYGLNLLSSSTFSAGTGSDQLWTLAVDTLTGHAFAGGFVTPTVTQQIWAGKYQLPDTGFSNVAVVAASTAPVSIDGTSADVPVLYADMTSYGGATPLGFFTVTLIGDVPPSLVTVDLWRDDGDNQFNAALDVHIASTSFSAPGGGLPPYAMLPTSETLTWGVKRRYYVTARLTGVPSGRSLSFAFNQPGDFGVPNNNLSFPLVSNPTLVRLRVYADPINGVSDYAFPVAGTTNSGGLDTGLFVHAGQRVHSVTVPGDTWTVPGTVNADGSAPTGGLNGAFNRGLLVGRIGSGAWLSLGQVSTVTATSAGELYVAANDTVYSDNAGFVRAAFDILPSTTTKVWIGGTLGFETRADIDQNWTGGRPFPGEHVLFDASAYDCDWNIPTVQVADLTVSTAFLHTIRLVSPPNQFGNRLIVAGDATIRGGNFSLNLGSGTANGQFALTVDGRLVVRDTATLDINGGKLELGLGGEFRAGAVLRDDGFGMISRAIPALPWYMRVDNATMNVTGSLSMTGMDYLDFSTPTIVALDNLTFSNFAASTSPLARFFSSVPVTYVFNNWSALPPARTPYGVVAALPAGSNVVFNNSAVVTGTSFGTPNTQDPNGVVHWIPDGGGSFGQISGTLFGPGPQAYLVVASTSPTGENTFAGGSTSLSISGSGPYNITALRAPSTYFLFAYVDNGSGAPLQFFSRGGLGHNGEFRSNPIFLPSGASLPGNNITLGPWGVIGGNVNNFSNQVGPLIVETWQGQPNVIGSTRQARGVASPTYAFQTPSDNGGVLCSSSVFAFVDANLNGSWDVFEASATFAPFSLAPASTAAAPTLSLFGGGAAPGGAVALSTQAVHFGAIGAFGPQPLIRLRMTASVSTASFSGVKLRYLGAQVASAFLGLWQDDGDGAFSPGDQQIGSAVVFAGGPSTATIVLSSAAVLQTGTPRDFFVTLELNSTPVPLAGVMIDAATSFTLAAGTFSVTPGFPITTGVLPVFTPVNAYETATQDLQGGLRTGFFPFPGQLLSIVSTGSWRTGPADAPTGPGGQPGTTGLNTVAPVANRSELIGRLRNTDGNSSPWFRVGASTSFFVTSHDELVLAMNDFVGAYYDNSGSVLVSYTAAGSTVGAISGQVFYSTPVAGTVTITARNNGSPMASTNVLVGAATSYPFLITGLPGGNYDLIASNSTPPDFGLSNDQELLQAGTTAQLNVYMYKNTGGISGSVTYNGVQDYGDFRIGVATVTDFSGSVYFFGGAGPSSGAFLVGGLPTPSTYYVVGYRDGNGNNQPDGPEPLGYYGTPGGGLNSLASFLTPVFVAAGSTATSVNVVLQDMGSIEGSAVLLPGATGTLVVEARRGVSGGPGFAVENRAVIPLPGVIPSAGVFYSVGLLRPATGYTLFAFLDKNHDGQPSAGEEQLTAPAAITVPSGGRARLDFSLTALTAPPAPAAFTAVPSVVSTITFSWNLVPGATAYQLRRANNSVFVTLGAAASVYLDVLPDNTSSQIVSISASNGNGVSTTTALAGPVFTLASAPTAPSVSAVTALSATVAWGGTNPAGTVYEVVRATAAAAPATPVFFGAAASFGNSLAPASTYYWTVHARNGNGLYSAFSPSVSTVTLPLTGPAIAGVVTYPGAQTAGGAGFVIEASTSSATFFPRVSSAALAGAPQQPWYLAVPAGTYFVRAFVDVAGNGVLQPSADRGFVGSITVGASLVGGQNFTVLKDTVPPGAPAGVVAAGGNNKVTLTWAPPTKNANGTNLVDLAGYVVERATAPAAPFVASPAALSSSAASFVDSAPIPGVANFYRVRAFDVGGNQSAPSGAVSAVPSAGGSISGQIRSISAAAAGQYRVRLATSPASTAPSVAEAALTNYTFTGLADGVYYLRAFRDLNGDGAQDPINEPAGTFGGLNLPFPISIVNGNAVSGADATICDRSPLSPPFVIGFLSAAGCPALDKGPGFTTNLYAFTVGGGAPGSFGVGSQINLAMSTDTAFATDIILLGPDGRVFGRDNRVGGANLTVTLTQPGVYLAEPTSFQVNGSGSFQMNMRVDGGFAGSISGSVTYAGGQTGLVYTQLFNSASPSALPILTSTTTTPGAFSFAALPDGPYYIRSFRDNNGNGVRDSGEPSGQFGAASSLPSPVLISGGVVSGGPFVVPITDPVVGTIRGAALYEGTAFGALRVEAGRNVCQPGNGCFESVVAFTTVAAGSVYTLPFLTPATDYFVNAFVDSNGNGVQDALEPAISSFPVTVAAASTATVGMIVRDGGGGAFGTAIVIGSVTYSGASTGPVVIGLSRDPQFRSIDYLIVLPATGSFSRSGLQGDATYYMAGFIDTNLNNSPDYALGEPAAAGSTVPFGYTPGLDSPPPIYVPANSVTPVQLVLSDPPNASVIGTVRYAGSAGGTNIVLTANASPATFGEQPATVVIPRVAGVSTYTFQLNFLKGADYNISAFVDSNGNGRGDNGEPFGSRPPVHLSSGAGSFPTYGADLDVLDPGSLGASLSAGRIHGEMTYLGTQAGPMYVRFFNNENFLGTPLFTLRVPASGLPPVGSGEFIFDRPNLPFGTYYLDAFRDPSGIGVYNPAAHAHGLLNSGSAVTVSQDQTDRSVFGGSISDPGQGGSVNVFTGSFAAPGGARFDGGATDLGAIIEIDSAPASGAGPQPVVIGVTAQNDGVDAWGVRYSSNGLVISSAVISVDDLQVSKFAIGAGEVFVPGRIEDPGVYGATATLTEYDPAFIEANYNEFPDYQGLDGLSYQGPYLLAASRYLPNNDVRVLKIDASLNLYAIGSFSNPGGCQYCQTRVQGAAMSPDGLTYMVYAVVNQQNDDDRGLHFLLKFNGSTLSLMSQKDVTALGAPVRGGGVTMAVDNAGAVYLTFATDGNTARTFKFDVSGAAITQTASAAYGPIQVHFSGGLGNLRLDPANGHPYEVWESTTNAGDYMLLHYDQSLNLVGQRFFDGLNNTLEDTAFSLAIYNSSTVFVTGAVNNGQNLDWGTLRLNGNGSGSSSAAGTGVSITTANAINYIAGTVSYGGGLVTSGTVRMELIPSYGEVPIRFATAPFGGSSPFLFNNVPSGTYDVRAFVDPNNNLNPDEGEPTAHSTLYGIEFAAGTAAAGPNSLDLPDPVQLCDRRQIAFGVDVVQSLTAADCTSPDRAGAPRRLYTFSGTRGQPVTIAMNALGFYDSYLDLYGPDGSWLEYNDDGGGDGDALISNFVLPDDGVYTIDAQAYGSGSFGQFKLSLSGSAGALGGIAGRVNYSGSQGGAVIVGLFNSPTFSTATTVGRLVLTSTRSFSFDSLAVGTTYYLGAFIDVNANNTPDAGEDAGTFGVAGVPSPILLSPGQFATGVEIAVAPSTTSAASAAFVTGTASYAGTRTGPLVLEFWSNSQFTGHPVASRVIPTGVGSYDAAVAGGVPYYIRAYIDANADFALQPDEPRGVYAPHAQGAEQLFVPAGQTLVGVDVLLKDPGQTAGGGIAGEGTAVLSSTFVVSGRQNSMLITYTVGANGIASTGSIGFTAPPGFSFPAASFGSSVTVTSTATAFGALTFSGPSVFVSPTSSMTVGQQAVFQWTSFFTPCALGVATVTVSAAQNGLAAPSPLFLGSPSLAVAAGPASYASLDQPYFSVKQDELSDIRRVVTYDACGSRVGVASPTTIDLAARRFNGSSFVSDPQVGVATSTVLSTAAAVTLNFDVGQSSQPFYVLAASTGFKYLEVHSPLGLAPGSTYYFGVTAMPANALTAVSVSTASGGVALSSAAIALAANGQPNSIFINFTLGDPQQPWHVLVSSLPFKVGEVPSSVWERWGYGQPNAGEIAWDGRFSPWINGGARVPNALYYGRVEVGGGGGVKDDTIRMTVLLPQFAGSAFDPGTVPNPPLSGVSLRLYGPTGYFTAGTGTDGTYVLPGLGAGNYRLNASRPDYVDGGIDLTLNALGVATSFVPRTPGLFVSSNATGGLDLFLSRAPRLIVVPSLDPSIGAAAADQWGTLQIRPSTSTQQSSTFYGPMRLKGGTTTFDDGGQWDTSTQQFIAKTLLGFNVPVGTYTVVADLNGYSRSTGSVYVGPDGARIDLTPFLPKAVITGEVRYAPGAPAPGLSVGLTGVALSTSIATTGLSGGAFIVTGATYAVYSISGFDAGAYLLRANTQGLSAVTTGPIVVNGTATVSGVNFPNFGAGASITGTISVVAPNGTQIFVNAWSPGSFNFGSTVVFVNANAASYAMNGLDAGATYQLYANINAQGDYDVAGGFPRKDVPPLVDNFTLAPASGVISGLILLPPGDTDFANVTINGVTIASLHPDEVGHNFVDVSTNLPNFLCGNGASGATGYCPAGVSSATFRVQGINTQTLDVHFLHSTTGQSTRHTVSVVNGSTFSLISDLRGSTYSISGFLINQIGDTLFNTNDKIVANAPYIRPQGYPAGLSSTTARVTATRQDIDAFGVAISTVFDPVSSRVGFLDVSGNFTIPNCPNGVYVVRTTDLRSCSTCAVIAPAVGRVVSVSNSSVSSVTLVVSNGFAVSGSIALDGGMLDAQIFDIAVLNRRQEIVRSTVSYLGDVNLGQQSGSVDYSFTSLPAGEFYTLLVNGRGFPVKYAGRPIKFPDPALSPTGLQSNLVGQNVLLQRAAYLTGRLKDGGTGELIGAANATLLAPNFAITATANPWTEGGFSAAASSIAARPIQGDGYFRVGPLVPDVSYDLRLAQATWDPNFLASGSQNYAPVTIGGLKPAPGEIRDIGTVALGQGQSVTGVVRSTTTGLALGNIKVVAKPSFGGDDLVAQTYTNSQGVYSLWVTSAVSNQFNLIAAPRDGNQASDGRYYGTVVLSNVNLQTQTSANFLLTPLSVVVTGQLVVADAASGGALSYPFGDKRGFPAGAINLQPVGVVPTNPLGDIEGTTDAQGFFSVPGLSTGIYALHATSLGYAVYNASVQVLGSAFHIFVGSNTPSNDLPGGVLTLARGATATGRILKSDGSSPNSSEVVGVAAANFGAGEFVVGSVQTDAVAKTVSAYTISGFKPGVNYNIVLLSGANGKEVSFPPEGAGVVFAAADSSTTKTINLTYRPAALDCLGTAKALDAARSKFLVQIDCLKPLRQQTAADDDLTTILTLSTFTSLGAALTSPNGAGVLNNPSNSTNRRRLTATYTLAPLETRFSMRIRASASEVDPRTGDNFAIDKVFDFYAGLDSAADGRASNINGGSVGMNPSAQDELLGLDERSRIDLPPGAFGEGSDNLPDAGVVANPTTTVNVSMTKGRDQQLAKALSIAAVGYAPAALSVPDVPSAFPNEMWAAMSQYRTMAATTTVGGANPLSAFYSIFLPAGIRHQLKASADLTLSYSLAASTGTTDDKVQVWFYNAVLGRFVLENTNRRLDTVNKTVTVSVNHFSTFVVLDSTPTATSTVSFGGADIAVANFPNPADCITHSNIARNSTLFGSGGVHAPFVGTMLRTSIPLSGTPAELRYNIYTVAGEKIRTIEQGTVPPGQTYYTPWNCTNDAGRTVASGVYIGEVIHGGRRKFFKIAIIKGSGL